VGASVGVRAFAGRVVVVVLSFGEPARRDCAMPGDARVPALWELEPGTSRSPPPALARPVNSPTHQPTTHAPNRESAHREPNPTVASSAGTAPPGVVVVAVDVRWMRGGCAVGVVVALPAGSCSAAPPAALPALHFMAHPRRIHLSLGPGSPLTCSRTQHDDGAAGGARGRKVGASAGPGGA
jgi:hypothetical protein